jgi:Signal transduction histidine kinase, nitrate/nitrite-specific
MNKSLFRNFSPQVEEGQSGDNTRKRNAILIATFMALLLGSLTLYFLLSRTLIDFNFIGALVITMIVAILSARFSYRGHVQLSMVALIVTILVVPITYQFRSMGDGLFNATLTLMTVVGIAIPTLSGKWLGRAVLAGGAGAALVLLIDLFGPAGRTQYTLNIRDYVIIAVLAGVLFFFALRGFRNYNLATKLVFAFLAVSIIPTVGLSYYNTLIARQDLTNAADLNLKSAASGAVEEIDGFIQDNLDIIDSNAQLHILTEYLELPPSERPGSETETALYDDLTALSHRDQTYLSSVALLDKRGRDVADTVLSDVGAAKSDRLYFTEAVKSGSPYVSPMLVSATTGKASIYFSAPVRDGGGNIIGVMRVRYDADILLELMADNANAAGKNAFMMVLDENFIRLADSKTADARLKTLVPLPAEKLAKLQSGSDPRLPAGTAEELSSSLPELQRALENMDVQPSFQSEFHPEEEGITDTSAERGFALRLTTQPWVLVVGQPTEIFLAPVKAQTRNSLVIALIVAGLVSAVAYFMSQLLSRPILRLTNVAKQIAGGDLNAQAPVTSTDEIGTLATTFNEMTGRLNQAFEDVRRRALAVQTSAEVSRRLSTATSPRQLAVEAVEQMQSAFHYYHAHIYFVDEETGDLVIAGGTGEAGATLLARGHKVPKGRGLVGQAAETNVPVLVPDVSQAEGWLPNPLLTDTKCEAAIPISLGKKVLGVLDVQQNVVNGLNEVDVELLQSLAAQVAISLQNAHAFEESRAKAELESLVNTIGQKIQKTTSMEDTLQTAIREVGLALGASRVSANIARQQADDHNASQN